MTFYEKINVGFIQKLILCIFSISDQNLISYLLIRYFINFSLLSLMKKNHKTTFVKKTLSFFSDFA